MNQRSSERIEAEPESLPRYPQPGSPARGAAITQTGFSALAVLLILLSGLSFPFSAAAAAPSVAVLYPDIGEPYRQVFLDIIRGIESELKHPVKPYLLPPQGDSSAEIGERMKADRIDVVIALGRAGYSAAQSLAKALPVVVGAVLISPGQATQGLSGISLTPDPEILFGRLKELVPQAKDITVIYDPGRKADEITRARRAAEARGLVLHAFPATDLRLSASFHQRATQEFKGGSVALWLPQDNAAMDEQALLPMVLKEAWEKSFVVFSSNLDHVRKGALFSLYPDNVRMGSSLAAMARGLVQAEPKRPPLIEPLRDVQIAVNLRTAEHLGLNLDSTTNHKFGLTFPPSP